MLIDQQGKRVANVLFRPPAMRSEVAITPLIESLQRVTKPLEIPFTLEETT